MAWGLQSFATLALVWLALNGLSGWPVGLLAAAAGAALGAAVVPADAYPWRPLRLLGFFGYFIVESVRGGADVAVRAFARTPRVAPEFIRFHTDLPPGQPLTLFVSVISLLPGTLSAGVADDRGEVVVHLLVPSARAGVERLERRVARVFGR